MHAISPNIRVRAYNTICEKGLDPLNILHKSSVIMKVLRYNLKISIYFIPSIFGPARRNILMSSSYEYAIKIN